MRCSTFIIVNILQARKLFEFQVDVEKLMVTCAQAKAKPLKYSSKVGSLESCRAGGGVYDCRSGQNCALIFLICKIKKWRNVLMKGAYLCIAVGYWEKASGIKAG